MGDVTIIPTTANVDGVTLEKTSGVINIKAGGVDTLQLADGAATAPKTDLVAVDGTTGKVNPINSTNFEDLSGANLTSLPQTIPISSANYTSATEYTETYSAGAWTTKLTLTFTPTNSSNRILGLRFVCDTTDGVGTNGSGIKLIWTAVNAGVSGTMVSNISFGTNDYGYFTTPILFWDVGLHNASDTGGAGEQWEKGATPTNANTNGTTYTLVVQMKKLTTGTSRMKNINVTVYWLNIANCGTAGTLA